MNKLLKGINLQDRISVPTRRSFTDAGQMIVPAAFARTGVLIYTAKSLGLTDYEPDELIEIHRKEEDVFAEDSMASFRSAPVTLGHPKDDKGHGIKVTSENAKYLQVGMLEGMPTRDEDLLTGTLVITSKEAIDEIENGVSELSAGYTCDVYEADGKLYQTNIKANHIAIVKKGRAGSSCSIADEAEDFTIHSTGKEEEDAGKVHAAKSKSEIKDITDEFKAEQDAVQSESNLEGNEIQTEQIVEDMTEAEAANLIAEYEEQETVSAEMEADWAKSYASDTEMLAKAHAEVAKAARKIAKNKAKSMSDSAEEGGDYNLASDVELILVALQDADDLVVALQDSLQELKDKMESEVLLRSDTIIKAKDMTDLNDFTGLSVVEIKKLVLADVNPELDLSGKGEAYIEARFDILSEDSDLDTPMGRLLKKQVVEDAKPKVYEDPVAKARKAMIERTSKK